MATSVSVGVMFRREQPPEDHFAHARRIEAAGFDELWVVEDCFYTGGIAQAATALAATNRIAVGLGIAPAVARNASFLAMEFATLARMHPGRFHGGIGHGVAEWMEQIGARPASWLAALEETTVAVRALLRGDEMSVAGQTVRLRDVRLEHVPDPPPRISLGVRGAKSLALAGRHADGTILAEASAPAYVAWARERIEDGMRTAGNTQPHRLMIYALCAVSRTDPDAARSAVRPAMAEMIAGGESPQIAPLPYGAELSELAAGGAERLARELPDAWLDDLTITGTPGEGASAIARLHAAGADAVVLVPPATVDPGQWLDDVRQMLPLVREKA